MIKILTYYYPQIISDLPVFGGPSRQLKEFKKFLENKDKEYQLIGLSVNTNPDNPAGLKKHNQRSDKFYQLGMPGLKYMDDIKTFKSLNDLRQKFTAIIEATGEIIKEEKPDIVFLNGFSWIVWLMLQAINRARLPVVFVRSGISTKEFKIYEDFFGEKATKVMLEMEKTVSAENFHNIFLNEFSQKVYENEALEKNAKILLSCPCPSREIT